MSDARPMIECVACHGDDHHLAVCTLCDGAGRVEVPLVCAWCDSRMRGPADPRITPSHGICPACFEAERAKLMEHEVGHVVPGCVACDENERVGQEKCPDHGRT